MRRRSLLFGGVLGGVLSSLPRVFGKKAIYLSDFGYRPSEDNTESFKMAEAAAVLKNMPLVLPQNAEIKLSKPIVIRTHLEGNGTVFSATNNDVFIRLTNSQCEKQIVENITYIGNGSSNGIFIDETKDILLKGCTIKNCLDISLSVYRSKNIELINNKIDQTAAVSIESVKSKNIWSDGVELKGQA